MKRRNKAILAAGMLAGSCALTGCASGGAPQPTPSPDVAQQQSAEPSPEASAEPKEEAPIPLWVDGREAENAAVEENGALLLPLIETGEALGWTAESEELTEETQIVYVPAAFFEEAMDASVMRKENAVEVSSLESTATPETMPQEENKTE